MGETITKAWKGVFTPPLKDRKSKLRNTGITMLMDKGLSLAETENILSTGADYIDFIKFGFGTSAFYSSQLLKDKIKLIRDHLVEPYPGGTFLEVALMQGNLDLYLERARDLGFKYVEVSDGTISISDEVRTYTIGRAIEFGFHVISEVGKKNPQDKLTRNKIVKQIEQDLENGAKYVILEGRESGKGVGIYNQKGDIDEKSMEDIVEGFDKLDKLIWEAPHKSQQLALIERFGVNVSLGNIPPGEVLALEALRVGLRGDTLRHVIHSTDNEYSWKLPDQVVSNK
ncbi:phosphosulfolactate synthase [Desulfitispora alkaliphila]